MKSVSWFFGIARAVSAASGCPRANVGAILVRPKEGIILATGHNGAPRGMAQCSEVGCNIVHGHCVTAEHAERNAIFNAARVGVSTAGAHAYVTHRPCRDCARALFQAGIVSVRYALEYGPVDPMLLMLDAKGMKLSRASRDMAIAAGFSQEAFDGALVSPHATAGPHTQQVHREGRPAGAPARGDSRRSVGRADDGTGVGCTGAGADGADPR